MFGQRANISVRVSERLPLTEYSGLVRTALEVFYFVRALLRVHRRVIPHLIGCAPSRKQQPIYCKPIRS
jgi:hypothetical protein